MRFALCYGDPFQRSIFVFVPIFSNSQAVKHVLEPAKSAAPSKGIQQLFADTLILKREKVIHDLPFMDVKLRREPYIDAFIVFQDLPCRLDELVLLLKVFFQRFFLLYCPDLFIADSDNVP